MPDKYLALRSLFPKCSRDSWPPDTEDFAKLIMLLERPFGQLSPDEITLLLWRLRSYGDQSLFGSCLPDVMNLYVQSGYCPFDFALYAGLLYWVEEWSGPQYDALSEAILGRMQIKRSKETQYGRVALSPTDLSFLILWLNDVTFLDAPLREISHLLQSKDRSVWLASSGMYDLLGLVEDLRERPLERLYDSATGATCCECRPKCSAEREVRVLNLMKGYGLISSA